MPLHESAYGPANAALLNHIELSVTVFNEIDFAAGDPRQSLERELGEYWVESCMKLVRRVCVRFQIGCRLRCRQVRLLMERLVEGCALESRMSGDDDAEVRRRDYPAP